MDADAEPCVMGRVVPSSEGKRRVAAEEELHGIGRVAQSAEEAASEGLGESAAGESTLVQFWVDA